MATWTRTSSTSRTWTLVGAARAALIATTAFSAGAAYVAQFPGAEEGLRFWVGDALGLTGMEVGFDTTGTGGDVFLRIVTLGSPAGAVASELHTLTTATPGTLDVRLVGREVQVRLNGADAAILTYTLPSDSIILRMMHWGYVSNHNGCTVVNPTVYTLENVVQARAEVLVGVCGGNTSQCADGTSMKQIGVGNFNATGPVSLCGYAQMMYGVDGMHPVVIDPIAETAGVWTLAAGTHLGGDDVTTRATFVFRYFDRIGQGGDAQDPQNLLFFGIGTPLNADTGAERSGRAYLLSGAGGRVGSPVTGARQMSSGALNIGCVDSIWVMTGDLALGNLDVVPRAESSVGCSGNEALAQGPEGLMIGHGPEGLFILQGSGPPIPLSSSWLTKVIQFARADIGLYLVQVRYDATRLLVHVFLTPRTAASDPTTPVRHFVYSVRIGGWARDSGGFFELRWPDSLTPTASAVWQGEVVWGTRNGLVCKFSDEATDDDGLPIDVKVCLSLIKAGPIRNDTVLESVQVKTGKDSGPITVSVYGGVGAEEAYDKDPLELRWSETISSPGKLIRRGAKAPALVMELSQNSATETMSLEAVDVVVTISRGLTPARRRPPAAAPTPCGPAAAEPTDPNGGGPGPGGEPGGTCTACDDWMDENGEGGSYVMAGFEFLPEAQAMTQKSAAILLSANICDLPEDFVVRVDRDGWMAPEDELLSEFLARTDLDAHKWTVSFRCDIQGEA